MDVENLSSGMNHYYIIYVHVNTNRVLGNSEFLFTDKLKGLFKINFSEKGSNKRSFEEQAYNYLLR